MPIKQGYKQLKHTKMTDQEITDAMAKALGNYFRLHPEVASIKVRCYGENESLLRDLSFSPPLPIAPSRMAGMARFIADQAQ
jgi:hypothetical protein